jgi:hypothetical protein
MYVLNPAVKFLEGYIIDSLREYGIKSPHCDQFEFASGKNINHCKDALLDELLLHRRQLLKKPSVVLFVDFP